MGLLNPLPTGAEALSPELQSQLRKRNIWASIGDGLIAAGGGKPFGQKAVEDRVSGLLDAQLKQQERDDLQRQGANQRAGIHGLLEAGYLDAPTKLMLDKMDPASVADILTKIHDPYTLSAEQGRYFGLNPNPIAERGPKAPEPFTLGSGQTRYGPDGTPIAQLGTNEQRNAASGLRPEEASTTALRTLEGKISMAMQLPRFDGLREDPRALREAAFDFVERYPTLQFMQNPETGEIISIDKSSPNYNAQKLDVGGYEPPPNVPPARGTTDPADLRIDPGLGTGFWSTAKLKWNETAGQIPFFRVFKDEAQAAQSLRYLERDAINAFRSSARPPVIEQERITRLFPQPQMWTENPRVARDMLASAVDIMVEQYRADTAYMNTPGISRTEREEARNRARDMQAMLSRVVKPDHLVNLGVYDAPAGTGSASDMPEDVRRALEEVGIQP